MASENKSLFDTIIKDLITSLFFAFFVFLVAYGFIKILEPFERKHIDKFEKRYDSERLLGALTNSEYELFLEKIKGCTYTDYPKTITRRSGSKGGEATADFILETFKRYGLETLTQEFSAVVPEFTVCEVRDNDDNLINDVNLYPVEPTGLQTIYLPKDGVRGKLVFIERTDLELLDGVNLTNSIVLTYLREDFDFKTMAALGVKAVLVMEDIEMRKLKGDSDEPDAWAQLYSSYEVGYPIFVVRGNITNYVGKEIRLLCDLRWAQKRARNIFGVLKGKGTKKEALIISTYYDSSSMVVGLAPGGEQAISIAAMLELARVFSLYKNELERDVIFLATASHAEYLKGAAHVIQALTIGPNSVYGNESLEDRVNNEKRALDFVKRGFSIIQNADFWSGEPEKVEMLLANESTDFRLWFNERIKQVLGDINLEDKEKALQARLNYLRAGSPVYKEGFDPLKATEEERHNKANNHPLLLAYIAASERENISGNLLSVPVTQLCSRKEVVEYNFKERIFNMLNKLESYHSMKLKEYQDMLAVRKVFNRYDGLLLISLELFSGGADQKNKAISIFTGVANVGTIVEPQGSMLADLLRDSIKELGNASEVLYWGGRDKVGDKEKPNLHYTWNLVFESELWTKFGYLAFTVVNGSFFPKKLATPEDVFEVLHSEVPKYHIQLLSQSLLAVADGCIPIKMMPDFRKYAFKIVSGKLVCRAGVGSLAPSHPVGEDAYVSLVIRNQKYNFVRGVKNYLVTYADPYGRFVFEPFDDAWNQGFLIAASRFDKNGTMIYRNDMGTSYSMEGNRITIPMFRCVPIQIYPINNPVTMQSFKGVNFINMQGLNMPASYCRTPYVFYVSPDMRFYIVLQDGAMGNKEILANRGFLLNLVEAGPEPETSEQEIYGKGYLAADTSIITIPQLDATTSILRVNKKRIMLQQRYNMADQLILDFHDKAIEWLNLAKEKFKKQENLAGYIFAYKSFAYALNNHPVIRQKIYEAILGILWYLGLLVPFVFFFEKLVFGFTDIRKQLIASALIFLVVFVLLKIFHPAFQMVRSSLMILLGFLILLLTLLVVFMVSGKFKQNIKELRSKEGKIEGADINRGGVIGTAFMLGLNNMRRRKVRTALTCITLVLLTFVMICFTSVSTDLVDTEVVVGKSSWDGIIYRKENFLSIKPEEIVSLKDMYGKMYPMVTRSWMIYNIDNSAIIKNSEINIDREIKIGENQIQKRALINAILKLETYEPMFTKIDKALLTTNGWFPPLPVSREELALAIKSGQRQEKLAILPDSVAKELDISVDDVNSGNVKILIRKEEYKVHGIIDSKYLERITDPDGRSILPVDFNYIKQMGKVNNEALIPEDAKPLSPSQIIIVNQYPPMTEEKEQIVSVAILFPSTPYKIPGSNKEMQPLSYKEKKKIIFELLERTQESGYYSIDGVAYYGARKRAKTVEGLIELIIPLILAGLTVFNTMRNSVYERRDEIYVYNAVGIAPNHVFFMFMAEALVYAVVGAILGYIFSQSVGTIMTALNLTSGLNMNYSSIETIYASLAIIFAVLFSTIMPARDAAKLASPSDQRDWTIPEPEGDVLSFNLPFTFTPRDRIAVIEYFRRWLDANGEGSVGPFFASQPQVSFIKDVNSKEPDAIAPVISSTIWLKPFDLGVSQKMEIILPTDLETKEFIAQVKLTRLSGSITSWLRTVKPFLYVLRKQFLNWRAATLSERAEMYQEAKNLMYDSITRKG